MESSTGGDSSKDLKDHLHEFSPVGQILVQVSSLGQSVAPQRGLVLDAGPEGLQPVQPAVDGALGLWLPPAESSALHPPPGHVLTDQNQLPLVVGRKNSREKMNVGGDPGETVTVQTQCRDTSMF